MTYNLVDMQLCKNQKNAIVLKRRSANAWHDDAIVEWNLTGKKELKRRIKEVIL